MTGDGLISLDVDGPKGQETLAGLTEKYGPVPKTLKVKTGRGEHLWFGYDQERYPYVKSTANTEIGLDIRADGGYVIAPPSKHYSGVTYEFSEVNREGLAEAPQWVLNYALSGCNSFEAIEEPSGLAGASDPPLYTQAEAERIRSALSAIPANKRDIWVRVGAALHSTGWGDPARQLYDDWSRTCPEKFDEAEQAKIWRSFDRPYTGEKVGLGTLFHLATEHGWSDRGSAASNVEQIVDVLNERYIWLNDEQEIFDLKYLTTRKREQVRDDTAHLATKRGEKRVSGYDLWRCSPRKRRVAGRKFLPGQGQFVDVDIKGRPLGGTYINLWQGWGCEPEKGDVAPLEKLIRHLCAGNEDEIRYLKWRIAIKIQKPWLKIPSYVLVVTKEEGTGKSQLGKFLVGLYGKHGRIITDRELESSFDDWKADGVIFAVSEEVSLRDKKSAANRLKAMASMEVQQINPKGKPSYETENFLDLYFTANECDAMYVRTEKERRPFIVKHDGVMPMSAPDAKALQHWYDHGGQAAMLHYFLYEVDGAAFDTHAAAPVTEGKRTMAQVCQSPAEKFVDELLTDAAEDAAADGVPLREFKTLLSDFIGESSNKRDERLLSMALEKAEIPHRRPRVGANRTLYAVTNRGEWKAASNPAWSAQYELQTARTRVRRPTFLGRPIATV